MLTVGTIRAITKGVTTLRPFINAVRGVEEATRDLGMIAVLDGEPAATRRLREILGAGGDEPLRQGVGALVYAAVPDHDPALAANVLAGAKREGRRVLAVLVGTPQERAELERRILAERPLEPSNLAHVPSLDDPRPVLEQVVVFLDEDAVALARKYAPLRDPVADDLIGRASLQAGAIGAAALVADLPAITIVQVRLVAQLAALYGRPLDARRGIEVAGVIAGALGWRALARRAVRTVPVASFAIKGGVAYSATRAVGEAARKWFQEAGDRADQPMEGFNRAVTKALARVRRGT